MPKYIPNLRNYMDQCELNYICLCKLLPQLGEKDERTFGLEAGSGLRKVRCKVVERCKYTTTVELSEDDNVKGWLPHHAMTVRLYHDAQMAEVLAFQAHRNLQATYEYPNKRMYQRDEKAQNNQFLGEWLQFCLLHGQELMNPIRFEGTVAEPGR